MLVPSLSPAVAPDDTPDLRKARGAFFTPDEITGFVARWAVRSPDDRVLDPSAGDAAFLVAAVDRLRALSPRPGVVPEVDGVEIHEHSARVGRRRVEESGGRARLQVSDVFDIQPTPTYAAVIGNPPYVRYQGWTGAARAKSRAAALRADVTLSGLASSWAAFTVHSARFLRAGGRLGLVLPAELLTVNYAAPVRRFLFDQFATVQVVVFDEQVFPQVEADVVVLMADGYRHGPSGHALVHRARDAAGLAHLATGRVWAPPDPSVKWTGSLVSPTAVETVQQLVARGVFAGLRTWGETTLGMVTGRNGYFALSPATATELGLQRHELLRLSPPGSSHLRGLELTPGMLRRLGEQGRATRLFRPRAVPSPAALRYIEAGRRAGVDQAYKCRVREPWYRVPLVRPADLLLTCMNADTPRLTTNTARAHHLNSVHGVDLSPGHRELGCELLPLASLNSVTVLSAELVGRAYGGGVLKIEPREADVWAMPSPAVIDAAADRLRAIRGEAVRLLRAGRLLAAVARVDEVLLGAQAGVGAVELDAVRSARAELAGRRETRARRGR